MTDRGFTDKLKGKVKKAAGELTGDDKLKAEGIADETVGKVKETVAEVKDVVEELGEKAKKKFGKK